MADIAFNCPYCSQDLVVDEEGAGLEIPCPQCGATIQIPYPQQSDAALDNSTQAVSTAFLSAPQIALEKSAQDLGQTKQVPVVTQPAKSVSAAVTQKLSLPPRPGGRPGMPPMSRPPMSSIGQSPLHSQSGGN